MRGKPWPILPSVVLCVATSCLQQQGGGGADDGATPAASDSPRGVSIAITAEGAIEITGTVQAGDGMSAPATSDATIRQQPAGDSGSLYADAVDYDWPGFDGNDISIDPIAYAMQTGNLVAGGFGGQAGALTVADDPVDCLLGSAGQGTGPNDDTIVSAGDGGHGWYAGAGGAGGQLTSVTGADGSAGNSIVGTITTEDAAPAGSPGSNVDPSHCP